jgi:hypothetical protein
MTATEKKLLDLLEKALIASAPIIVTDGSVVRFAPDSVWDEISETPAECGR